MRANASSHFRLSASGWLGQLASRVRRPDSILAAGLFRRFQPDQRPLLRLVLADVDQDGRLVLGQVVQARLAHRALVVSDRPGDPLRLFVHGALDENVRSTHQVRVVSPQSARLVDGQLHDVVRVGLIVLDQGENAKRHPLAGIGIR